MLDVVFSAKTITESLPETLHERTVLMVKFKQDECQGLRSRVNEELKCHIDILGMDGKVLGKMRKIEPISFESPSPESFDICLNAPFTFNNLGLLYEDENLLAYKSDHCLIKISPIIDAAFEVNDMSRKRNLSTNEDTSEPKRKRKKLQFNTNKALST